MPGDIKAAVRIDPTGYPTIYLNINLSYETQQAALRHELHHIEAGDMFSHLTIRDVETGAIRAEIPNIMCRGRIAWIDRAILYHKILLVMADKQKKEAADAPANIEKA